MEAADQTSQESKPSFLSFLTMKWMEIPDGSRVRFTRPQGYKTFFMLNSTEHEISTAHKN